MVLIIVDIGGDEWGEAVEETEEEVEVEVEDDEVEEGTGEGDTSFGEGADVVPGPTGEGPVRLVSGLGFSLISPIACNAVLLMLVRCRSSSFGLGFLIPSSYGIRRTMIKHNLL